MNPQQRDPGGPVRWGAKKIEKKRIIKAFWLFTFPKIGI